MLPRLQKLLQRLKTMSESGPSNLFQIARILKSNGTEGDLILTFRDIDTDDVDRQEPVFVYFDGLPVPFFFTSFEPKGRNRAVVHLCGVNSLADAEEIAGREVYADADSYETEDEDFVDMTGWTVLSADGKEAGIISDFEDIPGNPCAYLRTPDGREVMIPLHDDFVVSVGPDSRTVTMDLPEGLV